MTVSSYAAPVPWYLESAKTGNYTLVNSDNGTLFTTAGNAANITFTLPARTAVNPGFVVWFMNIVNFNMTIASAAGTDIVGVDNAAASNIIVQTPGQLIMGGQIGLVLNSVQTLWYVMIWTRNAITFS